MALAGGEVWVSVVAMAFADWMEATVVVVTGAEAETGGRK